MNAGLMEKEDMEKLGINPEVISFSFINIDFLGYRGVRIKVSIR